MPCLKVLSPSSHSCSTVGLGTLLDQIRPNFIIVIVVIAVTYIIIRCKQQRYNHHHHRNKTKSYSHYHSCYLKHHYRRHLLYSSINITIHKVLIYTEYHRTPPTPLPQASVPPPPRNQRVGGTLACGWRVGESQFRRLEKSLALCLLCVNIAIVIIAFLQYSSIFYQKSTKVMNSSTLCIA